MFFLNCKESEKETLCYPIALYFFGYTAIICLSLFDICNAL